MYQDIIDSIKTRKSHRRFSDRQVDRKDILTCIRAAAMAPSAENSQPWRFLVVDEPHIKTEIGKKALNGIYRPTRWALGAPVLVAIFAELDVLANRLGKQLTGIHYYLIDIGIAGEHLVLQAQALGLQTCWIGWFHPKGLAKALHTPRSWRPGAVIALGDSAQNPGQRKRKAINEICFFNHPDHPAENIEP